MGREPPLMAFRDCGGWSSTSRHFPVPDFLPHPRSWIGCDVPEILPYRLTRYCPIGADGGQFWPFGTELETKLTEALAKGEEK